MIAGVYLIRNRLDGHIYVGSSANVIRRWRNHWRLLREGKHHSTRLQRAFARDGEAAFEYVLLFRCDDELLTFFEQRLINRARPQYNICPDARNCLGRKHTPETRAKMAQAALGRRHTPETCQRMSQSRKGLRNGLGHHHTDEWKRKASERQKGRPHTPEHNAKVSQGKLRYERQRKEHA